MINLFGSIFGGVAKANAVRAEASARSGILYQQARFIRQRTVQEVEDYERQFSVMDSELRNKGGASNLLGSSSVIAQVAVQNSRFAREDVRRIKAAGEQEANNKRSEADLVFRSGSSSATNIMQESVFSGLSSGANTYFNFLKRG
jgi:hypothetical protein